MREVPRQQTAPTKLNQRYGDYVNQRRSFDAKDKLEAATPSRVLILLQEGPRRPRRRTEAGCRSVKHQGTKGAPRSRRSGPWRPPVGECSNTVPGRGCPMCGLTSPAEPGPGPPGGGCKGATPSCPPEA